MRFTRRYPSLGAATITWRCIRTWPFFPRIVKYVAPGVRGTTTRRVAESAITLMWEGLPIIMLPISWSRRISSDLSRVNSIAGCVESSVGFFDALSSDCDVGGRMSVTTFSARNFKGETMRIMADSKAINLHAFKRDKLVLCIVFM